MLRAIYYCGSSVILPNPRDVDIVYMYDTIEELHEAKRNKKKRDTDFNIHYELTTPRVFLGCYAYPYMRRIEGEDLHLENFSLLDHKDEYIAKIKEYVKFLQQHREDKKWYHVYLGISILDRGTMELSQEQRENAQKIHDEGINCELYNYIIDYLEKV